MAMTGISGAATPSGISGAAPQVKRDDFLKLLLAQVQNQNPLEPLKDGEFMAQLAQFSTVEGIDRLNASFEDMMRLQQLTQGANLVGRTVSYEEPGAGVRRGLVDSVFMQNGKLTLKIGDANVTVDRVRSVERS